MNKKEGAEAKAKLRGNPENTSAKMPMPIDSHSLRKASQIPEPIPPKKLRIPMGKINSVNKNLKLSPHLSPDTFLFRIYEAQNFTTF